MGLMARVSEIQTDFSAGELDPTLAAREDTPIYQAGVRRFENVVPLATGGCVRRGGFTVKGKGRGALSALSIAGATVTAPLGSNPNNGKDGSETTLVTTGVFATPDEVIYTIDYGSVPAGNQVAFDLVLAALAAAGSQTWQVQSSTDNVAWTTRGTITVDSTTAFSQRITASPGTNWGSPRYWRIRRSAGSSAVNATFAEIRLWTEAAAQAEPVLIPFTFAIDREYMLVGTAGNLDVFDDETGAFLASASIPHTQAQLEAATWAQSLDTLILFHKDQPPYRIFRLGADARWDFRQLAFETVQQFEWDDSTVSGGVNEQQSLLLALGSGDDYALEVNGQGTGAIVFANTPATDITRINDALEALDDVTSVTVTSLGGKDYQIEFTGVDGSKPWPLIVATLASGSSGSSAEVERVRRGRRPRAPLWDANHGYPSCGTFYQGRFYMGGFRDQPDLIAASRVGSFFDFDLDIADSIADDSPLQFRADSDEQLTINRLHAGRHLQIFATSGEFYIAEEPITSEKLSVKQTSRIGSQPGVPTVDVEGGTFFLAAGGREIREYLYVDTEQSYTPGSVSILAGHLVNEPRSVALKRQRSASRPALYLLANTGFDATGKPIPAAALGTIRSQQVTAFSRWTSERATFKAFGATQKGTIWAAVEREDLAGARTIYVEKQDDDALLDHSIRTLNPDVVEFEAAVGQTVFAYTFTGVAGNDDLAVFYQGGFKVGGEFFGDGRWELVPRQFYTLDTGAKTVTLSETVRPSPGRMPSRIRIAKRMRYLALDPLAAHFTTLRPFVMCDRMPMGVGFVHGNNPNMAVSATSLANHWNLTIATQHDAIDGTVTAQQAYDETWGTHPDGLHFWRFLDNTAVAQHYARLRIVNSITGTHAFSVDLKPINGTARETNIRLKMLNLDVGKIDVTLSGAGSVDAVGASVTASGIAALADGWYRVTGTYNAGMVDAQSLTIYLNDQAAEAGDGATGLYITRVVIYDTAVGVNTGLDLASLTPVAEVDYGVGFTSMIRTMPHRSDDARFGKTYGAKKRIPEATIQLSRCGDLTARIVSDMELDDLAATGDVAHNHVPGTFDSRGFRHWVYHQDRELVTGPAELSGMRGWRIEAALEVKGMHNMDFGVLSIGYRVIY